MKEKTETQYRNQTLFRHPFNVHSREVATLLWDLCHGVEAEAPYLFKEFESHSSLIGSLLLKLSVLPKTLCFYTTTSVCFFV